MSPSIASSSTLAHVLAERARDHGDRVAVGYHHDAGCRSALSYAELHRRVTALAASLQDLPASVEGQPTIVIVLPSGLDYAVAYFACLQVGAIAVTAYPTSLMSGSRAHALAHLTRIVEEARPAAVITRRDLVPNIEAAFFALPPRAEVRWVDVRADVTTDAEAAPIAARPDGIALVQYTSGSTGAPKGVLVSHANLLHNVAGIRAALPTPEGATICGWLPLYHDMGLIGMLCHGIYAGLTVELLTPTTFARRPALWLRTIAETGAVMTAAPGSAYELCVRRTPEDQRGELDLASLRYTLVGAEPVRAGMLESFAKCFEPVGFDADTFMPVYGCAEATLAVCLGGNDRGANVLDAAAEDLARGRARPAEDERAVPVVGCGRDFTTDTETVIVDLEGTRLCVEGEIGEIWITGSSVARGYLARPEAAADAFGARLPGDPGDERRFVRTGDVGFKRDGHLFVRGRVGDLVVQGGRGHQAHEIEATASMSHPTLEGRAGALVAWAGVIVLVHEVDRVSGAAHSHEIIERIGRRVADEHGLELDVVALVPKGTIPKTTSGKLRRHAVAERWQEASLPVLHQRPAA